MFTHVKSIYVVAICAALVFSATDALGGADLGQASCADISAKKK